MSKHLNLDNRSTTKSNLSRLLKECRLVFFGEKKFDSELNIEEFNSQVQTQDTIADSVLVNKKCSNLKKIKRKYLRRIDLNGSVSDVIKYKTNSTHSISDNSHLYIVEKSSQNTDERSSSGKHQICKCPDSSSHNVLCSSIMKKKGHLQHDSHQLRDFEQIMSLESIVEYKSLNNIHNTKCKTSSIVSVNPQVVNHNQLCLKNNSLINNKLAKCNKENIGKVKLLNIDSDLKSCSKKKVVNQLITHTKSVHKVQNVTPHHNKDICDGTNEHFKNNHTRMNLDINTNVETESSSVQTKEYWSNYINLKNCEPEEDANLNINNYVIPVEAVATCQVNITPTKVVCSDKALTPLSLQKENLTSSSQIHCEMFKTNFSSLLTTDSITSPILRSRKLKQRKYGRRHLRLPNFKITKCNIECNSVDLNNDVFCPLPPNSNIIQYVNTEIDHLSSSNLKEQIYPLPYQNQTSPVFEQTQCDQLQKKFDSVLTQKQIIPLNTQKQTEAASSQIHIDSLPTQKQDDIIPLQKKSVLVWSQESTDPVPSQITINIIPSPEANVYNQYSFMPEVPYRNTVALTTGCMDTRTAGLNNCSNDNGLLSVTTFISASEEICKETKTPLEGESTEAAVASEIMSPVLTSRGIIASSTSPVIGSCSSKGKSISNTYFNGVTNSNYCSSAVVKVSLPNAKRQLFSNFDGSQSCEKQDNVTVSGDVTRCSSQCSSDVRDKIYKCTDANKSRDSCTQDFVNIPCSIANITTTCVIDNVASPNHCLDLDCVELSPGGGIDSHNLVKDDQVNNLNMAIISVDTQCSLVGTQNKILESEHGNASLMDSQSSIIPVTSQIENINILQDCDTEILLNNQENVLMRSQNLDCPNNSWVSEEELDLMNKSFEIFHGPDEVDAAFPSQTSSVQVSVRDATPQSDSSDRISCCSSSSPCHDSFPTAALITTFNPDASTCPPVIGCEDRACGCSQFKKADAYLQSPMTNNKKDESVKLKSLKQDNTAHCEAISNNCSNLADALQPASPVLQPASHPAFQPAPQLVPQPSLQPASQPALRPVPQPTLQPVPQSPLQPVPQPPLQPVLQPALLTCREWLLQLHKTPSKELRQQDSVNPVLLHTPESSGKRIRKGGLAARLQRALAVWQSADTIRRHRTFPGGGSCSNIEMPRRLIDAHDKGVQARPSHCLSKTCNAGDKTHTDASEYLKMSKIVKNDSKVNDHCQQWHCAKRVKVDHSDLAKHETYSLHIFSDQNGDTNISKTRTCVPVTTVTAKRPLEESLTSIKSMSPLPLPFPLRPSPSLVHPEASNNVTDAKLVLRVLQHGSSREPLPSNAVLALLFVGIERHQQMVNNHVDVQTDVTPMHVTSKRQSSAVTECGTGTTPKCDNATLCQNNLGPNKNGSNGHPLLHKSVGVIKAHSDENSVCDIIRDNSASNEHIANEASVNGILRANDRKCSKDIHLNCPSNIVEYNGSIFGHSTNSSAMQHDGTECIMENVLVFFLQQLEQQLQPGDVFTVLPPWQQLVARPLRVLFVSHYRQEL